MFLGHYAVGLAAKRAAPGVSLGVLFGAAQLADILWPFLLALGAEQVRIDPGNTAFTPLDFASYPYSHSLLLLPVWGVAAGWLFVRRDRRAMALVALVVVSHWFLDALMHRPDLPLYPGGPRIGLGLWNSIPATIAVELGLYAVGVWMYVRGTRARDAVGRWGFAILAATLLLIFAGDALSSSAPPSVGALTAVAIAGGVLFTAWSWWADRHRTAVSGP
ncbi:MAG TPA: hypothetical protein VFK57_09890 [Vicinamibacterales bacterium]|nr:hypothetical protein [Vicinamibacterales bacterium]